ncbi:DUF2516 family protein [Actinoallomurus sp. NPDC052274]|uniref:DUF2516 family protein n=1 Tax=Actinoallomurus sp. NPDC052274 TaxID=3155420 RepID=UPI00343D8955
MLEPAQSFVGILLWVVAIAAFIVEIWAFADAVRRPSGAYSAAGKLTKQLWLIILGVALLFGLAGAVRFVSIIQMLPVIGFIAAAVYLADVRPAVRQYGRGGSSSGPYGPW